MIPIAADELHLTFACRGGGGGGGDLDKAKAAQQRPTCKYISRCTAAVQTSREEWEPPVVQTTPRSKLSRVKTLEGESSEPSHSCTFMRPFRLLDHSMIVLNLFEVMIQVLLFFLCVLHL